jgi:hypothetical protein
MENGERTSMNEDKNDVIDETVKSIDETIEAIYAIFESDKEAKKSE